MRAYISLYLLNFEFGYLQKILPETFFFQNYSFSLSEAIMMSQSSGGSIFNHVKARADHVVRRSRQNLCNILVFLVCLRAI